LPEGGVWLEGEEEERAGARTCWHHREREVLTTLINTAITAADFETALKVKLQSTGVLMSDYGLKQCFGSVLISIPVRIRIQHFRSIRIWIRIQVFS